VREADPERRRTGSGIADHALPGGRRERVDPAGLADQHTAVGLRQVDDAGTQFRHQPEDLAPGDQPEQDLRVGGAERDTVRQRQRRLEDPSGHPGVRRP